MVIPYRFKMGFWLLVIFLFNILFLAGNALAQVSEPMFSPLDQETVTITITNGSATSSACDIEVVNTIPPTGFSYVAGSSVVTSHDGNLTSTTDPDASGLVLSWDINDLLGTYELPPGESLTVEFDLETDCTAVSGTNDVTINYELCSDGTPFTENFSPTFSVSTGGQTNLVIRKLGTGTDPNMEISQCDQQSYRLVVRNRGTNGVALDTITDTLPQPGFTYVPGTAEVRYPNGAFQPLDDPGGSPGAPAWDMDGYHLGAGDRLVFRYDVATTCDVPGNLRNDLLVTYEDCDGPGEVAGLTNYEMLQGFLAISKTPEVAPATVGDIVTWTITAENRGEAAIQNVVVSDNWEDGLGNLNVVSVSDGETVSFPTANSLEVTFPEILPGESKEIVVELEVLSCDNLTNYANGSWGCDLGECYNSDPDETVLASIELIITEPLISYTVPDILIEPYCSSGSEVTIPVTNSGDGDAGMFELYVDFGDLDISNVSSNFGGMIYGPGAANPGANAFTGDGVDIIIPVGETLEITFTVNYPNWCEGGGAGSLIYEPYYSSGCDEGLAPPVVLGSYAGTPETSSLTITKTGPGVVDLGAQGTYTITANYTQPDPCNDPPSGLPTSATIVDTIPDGWSIVDAGTGTISGNTITWDWDPSATGGVFSENIVLQAPDGCEACNSLHENSVVVTLTDCCDCELTADVTEITVLRCNESSIDDSSRTATPVGNCGTTTYTNTYVFAADSTADYSTLTFTDDNETFQQYVAGSLSITRNGSAITATINDGTPGGTLVFDNFTAGTTAGTTLVVSYDMLMTPDTTTACGGADFYSWAGLQLEPASDTAQCPTVGDTSFVEVAVEPPAMSASVGSLPFFADTCGIFPITITVDRTSGLSNPYDVWAELDLDGFQIVNGQDGNGPITCSGVAPDACEPADLSAPEWRFGDRFAAAPGTSATIDLLVQAPCPGGDDLVATVHYDDECNEIANGGGEVYDDLCSSVDSDAAGLFLLPNLVIKKTAEQVFTVNNEVSWIIYVSNIGAGTANNLEVVDTLDTGITYTASSFDSNDPAFDPAAVTTDVNGQVITWTLPSLAPGTRAEITITGILGDCVNLNNNVSVSTGCLDEVCQEVTDSALVLSPAVSRLIMRQTVDPVVMCEETTASLFITNVGVPYAYNIVVTDILPTGVTYVPNTVQYSHNGAPFAPGPEPTITVNPDGSSSLEWRYDGGTGGLYDVLGILLPTDTLEITFDVDVDCEFVDGTLQADIVYENPCGDAGVTPSAVGLLQLSQPNLTIVSSRDPVIADCGDEVTWTIAVTNNGLSDAQVVQVTDTLGGSFTFDSVTSNPVIAPPVQVGNTLSWEFGPLALGETQTFELVATLDGADQCDDNEIFNLVEAAWGCGVVDGNPTTLPECLTEVDYFNNDEVQRAVPVLAATVEQNELEVCLEDGDPNNTIRVTLENVGTGLAQGIDAIIALPDGMGVVPGSVTLDANGSGAVPVTPVIGGDGNDLVFYNGVSDVPGSPLDLPDLDVGENHVVTFQVTTDCFQNGSTGTIGVSAVFQDCCGEPMDPFVPTPHPVTWLAPNIVLTKIQVDPAGDVDCASEVTWEITVTNDGEKDTDIVRLTDTLGDAFVFDNTTPGDNFYAVTPGDTAYLFDGTSVINWEIPGLAVDDSITYTLVATVNGGADGPGECGPGLDNILDAQWGCVPDANLPVDGDYATDEGTCYIVTTPVTHTVVRSIPVLDGEIAIVPDNLDACADADDLEISIDLLITGTTAYWLDLVVELPEQLYITPGTTQVTSDKYGGPDAWPDPTVAGSGDAGDPQTLTFYDVTVPPVPSHNDNIPDPNSLPDADSGETVNVTFSIESECFSGGPIRATLYFYDCCTNEYSQTVIQNLSENTPVLELTKTLAQEVDCRDEATWTVSVENTADTDAEVVLVEDTLPAGLVYVSAVPAPSQVDGQVIRWELPGTDVNGPGGWTVDLNTTVDRTQIPDCSDLTVRTNPVRATWGCAEDPGLLTYDGDITDWDCPSEEWFEAEALFPMPDLTIPDGGVVPELMCNADGDLTGTIAVTVDNIGDGSTTGNFVVHVEDSTGWTGTAEVTDLVAAGGTTTAVVTWDPDRWSDGDPTNNCAPDCEIDFTATVDFTDAVCECDEENNIQIFEDFLVDVPDLTITAVEPLPVCSAATAEVTVLNDGCGDAPAGAVVRIEGSGTDPDGNLVTISGEAATPAVLAPGASEIITVDLGTDIGCGFEYTLTTTVDPDSAICECNGENNEFETTVFVPCCSIDVEKSTNGQDADSPPGPVIPLDAPVEWIYVVTNTGDATLINVTLVDDQGAVISCDPSGPPIAELLPGETNAITCTANDLAIDGLYRNEADVVGTPVNADGTVIGENVTDSDPSHYFGADPSIDIEKSTNDEDADTRTGPYIEVDETVTWTFVITNTGNTDLINVAVNDDLLGTIDCGGQTTLEANPNYPDPPPASGDHTFTCTATGTAELGQYENLADVEGSAVDEDGNLIVFPDGTQLDPVTDDDPSHYFGFDPGIALEKFTEGEDADTPTGPFIVPGDPVTWTYVVFNGGNVNLIDVTVTDDQGVVVTCPQPTLAVGESMICTAPAGTAIEGQYANSADVVGTATNNETGEVLTDANGNPITVIDDDPSHYYGVVSSIDVEKATNGEDADTLTGPTLRVGDPVTWTYVVTNTGETTLINVTVTDSVLGDIGCTVAELAPDESFTCDPVTGTAEAGQYENVATANGQPVDTTGESIGDPVEDEDPSHYLAVAPGIALEKFTNGWNADDPTGPQIPEGDLVTWTYYIVNTGDVTLTEITLVDDVIGPIDCDGGIPDLLPAGEHYCYAMGTAIAGQYENGAVVTGQPVDAGGAPFGDPVDDDDPSHYFNAPFPSIDLEKATNGEDADTPIGPEIPVDDTVTWSYVITNNGNAPLIDLVLTDDILGPVTCNEGAIPDLNVGEQFTCTVTGTASGGQYANVGTVVGTPVDSEGNVIGPNVTDDDPSHYFGVYEPAIEVEKATNGEDADSAPGPAIGEGGTVTWTYVVTNTGNADLINVTVTDDQGVAVTCPQDTLAVGESMTCTASGTAATGQYANVGTVTGDPVDENGDPALDENGAELPPATDDDPSHYFGAEPGIDVEKATNGEDADTVTGPFVATGDPVTWTYVVTNTGNTTLNDISVNDDLLGLICTIASLAPGANQTCTAPGTAVAGQYANNATATGTPVDENGDPVTDGAGNPLPDVSDDDPSHYFGADASIDVEKATNGDDADNTYGPFIEPGQPVIWTYVITNTGNADLINVIVSDDQGVSVTCPSGNPIPSLAAGDSETCTATAAAIDTTGDPYENIATATGQPVDDSGTPFGDPVSDDDPSHYFNNPDQPSIGLEKLTNGEDADEITGPSIVEGDPVTWEYIVFNSGSQDLTEIALEDSDIGPITCPETELAVGESMTCTATGVAVLGQYSNQAVVSAIPVNDMGQPGNMVFDDDPSHYFGVTSAIELEKLTDGEDADDPTGPNILVGDEVIWTYIIHNAGDVALTNVVLQDDQIGFITCEEGDIPLLLPDEYFICTYVGTAEYGQYENSADVSGTPSDDNGNALTDADGNPLPDVTDDDPSHYFGFYEPSVEIEKSTNGIDADDPPGDSIPAGEPVVWEYVVTNTGNTDLIDVIVTDDQGVVVTCPQDMLAVDESMTCTGAEGIAAAGQYTNIGSVVGTPVDENGDPALDETGAPLPDVSDEDPSHYLGTVTAAIELQKLTRGEDADVPTGPYIPVGGLVTWTYVIHNTGNAPLGDIVLNDDILGDISGSCSEGPIPILLPDEYFYCTVRNFNNTFTGQYANVGDVTGTPVDENGTPLTDEEGAPLPDVTDEDPSHYFGAEPAIDVEKSTRGEDADDEPGPYILEGGLVTWEYVVTNTGNVILADVSVTDDQGVTVSCPLTTLAEGQSMTCTASGAAISGQYENNVTASGQPVDDSGTPFGDPVEDEDPSHYFGASPAIELEKYTEGEDADDAPGPYLVPGEPVSWSYTVFNTGNVDLDPVVVIDDQGVTVTCPQTRLAVNESMICEATGTAEAGQYENNATATGTPVDDENQPIVDENGDPVDDVTDEDPSHYFGFSPSIDVEKATNAADPANPTTEEDADDLTGPTLLVGDPVTWSYIVTNTGDTTLVDVTVTDSVLGDIGCVVPELAPGERFDCTPVTGTAQLDQYENLATAVGQPVDPNGQPVGDPVEDEDFSHYFALDPGIALEKHTNGWNADDPDGPYIVEDTHVLWTYVIFNTGNTTLTDIVLEDDQQGTISCEEGPIPDLLPDERFYCTYRSLAESGPYENIADVTGTAVDENGDPFLDEAGEPVTVTDDDPSHYYNSSEPGIDLEKATNGEDADDPTGPEIQVGDPVTWTYVITNTGNATLTGISLDDDILGAVACDEGAIPDLQPGLSFTCTVTGVAEVGQYANVGTVNGQPVDDDGNPVGNPLTDEDPSHYIGVYQASLEIEKATNGEDADDPAGPAVAVGGTVTWTYVVTNTGNTTLADVEVSDSDPSVTVTCPSGNPIPSLDPGASETCEATGVATAGQYENTATAGGTPVDEGGNPVGDPVEDDDPSHYLGAEPAITVEKATNGEDADDAPGPYIVEGDTVTWTYEVTNTGNVSLANVNVTDDQGVFISCPQSDLAVNESMTCTATGTAIVGPYVNNVTVSGTPVDEDGDPVTDGEGNEAPDVTDDDPSNYFGADPAIDVEKATNGDDADFSAGPFIAVGDTVTWLYVVTNTGNVDLIDVTVSDDQGVTVSCPQTTLGVGESMDCDASATAVDTSVLTDGRYANMATASGTPVDDDNNPLVDSGGTPVPDATDDDPSHYYNANEPGIGLEKLTNGQDADDPTGSYVLTGDPVTWTYVISNTGNTNLVFITLEDDQLGTITCNEGDIPELAPGEQFECTVDGIAEAGQYENNADVTGTPVDADGNRSGPDVTDEDPSHYFGVTPAITLEKTTDSEDADSPIGPTVPVGDTVYWNYIVYNSGDAPLTDITLFDDKIGPISCLEGPIEGATPGVLLPDETFSCTVIGTAEYGQYENNANVTGTPSDENGTPLTDGNGQPLPDVDDDDPSHYYGELLPAIDVEKATNGIDADDAPGDTIDVGDAITWTYVITNTGNTRLIDISLNDSVLGVITCEEGAIPDLDPGESFICSYSGIAIEGEYENIATVTGTPVDEDGAPVLGPDGAELPPVEDEDPSHYTGLYEPSIDLEKLTQGEDADEPTGPFILIDKPVTWTYIIYNTGNTDLANVVLVDDVLGPITCLEGEIPTIPKDEYFVCTVIGTAIRDQYENNADVTADPVNADGEVIGEPVTDADPSHYFGADPVIDLEKSTQGEDADEAPGPYILVDDEVVWEYLITNEGNVTLVDIVLEDDKLGVITCREGDIPDLAPGESFLCSVVGPAQADPYENNAVVSGTPVDDENIPIGKPVTDEDPSHYYGADPSIDVEKSTNDEDADEPSGPELTVGDRVTWTYVVTNTGNVTLVDIVLTDDKIGIIDCPKDTLIAGESMTCTANGTAQVGQYENNANVEGQPVDDEGQPVGDPVIDMDPSHYIGFELPVDEQPPGPGPDPGPEPPPVSPGICCLTLEKESRLASGIPEILPVDVQVWWDTADGLFAASEMAGFAAEAMDQQMTADQSGGQYQRLYAASDTTSIVVKAADQKMSEDRAGQQYQRLAGFMKQFAINNTGTMTMQSGLGVLLNLSDSDLAAMAADAGLDTVPTVNPVILPYAGMVPVYGKAGSSTWTTTQADRRITPAAVGAMLSAQAKLLPDMADSPNASDRFAAQVMVQQMANTIDAINQLPATDKGAFGNVYALDSNGGYDLKKGSAPIADQAMLLSGLLDARSAFATPPEGLDAAITKAWAALQSGFDADADLYADNGVLTADAAIAVTSALATLSGQHSDLPMAGEAGTQLATQVAAIAANLVGSDGAVVSAFDLKADKAQSGAKTLESAASVLAALLNHASGMDAAKTVYGFMNKRLWDEKNDLYRDTADWMMTGSYSARTLGAVVGGLGRLALLTDGAEQADVIDHLAQFVETVAVKGGMQLDGKRGGYLTDPGAVLFEGDTSGDTRQPLMVPSRRYRDQTIETGLGRETAPVLNSAITVNFAPLEAEKLQALRDSIDYRVERFGPRVPLYVEPERVPKLGNRESEPAANLLASIALAQAAPKLQALAADLDNGFTGRPVNLGVTSDMLASQSETALVKLKGQIDSGTLTLEELFPEATDAERQLLSEALAAPESADLAALALIDLYPDNPERESLADFAAPLLTATGDDLLQLAAAFDKRYWSDRIGTYLADEQQETQVGVRTTRYMYTPDDIGMTVAALTHVLGTADGELADRLATHLVAFATGLLEDTGVRLLTRPADEVRGVDLFLVDRERAYPGDSVEYTITVTNSGDAKGTGCQTFTDLPVADQLPSGVRYIAGSARVDGKPSDPAVEGRDSTYTIDRLSGGESVTITYRARLNEAAFGSSYTNTAQTGVAGCAAQARDVLTLGKAGRVKGVLYVDKNQDGRRGPGDRPLEQVRLILDENLATDTDNTGTFWFDGLVPGVYQVRIDTDRLPEGLVPTSDPVQTVIIGDGETYILDMGLVKEPD